MRKAKHTETTLAAQLLEGTRKRFATAGSLTFDNRTYTPAEVEAFLQTIVDLRTAVLDAQTAVRAAIVREAAQRPALRKKTASFAAFVKVTFGGAPDILADFGLKPDRAPTPLTIEVMAAAAAKRLATRAARHTMGKKEKARVKG